MGAEPSAEFVGPAGEALVEFDLLCRGIRVHRSAPGASFDLLAEVKGRLIRIEVKTSAKPSNRPRKSKGVKRNAVNVKTKYSFQLGSGKKPKSDRYENVEVFAFVALDRKVVLYYPCFEVRHNANRKDIGPSVFDQADKSFELCFGLAQI